MRNNFFMKTAGFSVLTGTVLGTTSALLSEASTVDSYGAWLPRFYDGEAAEIWIKSVISSSAFSLTAFLLGFFIMGYLFVLPICFYYGYTFSFLITSSLRCFGGTVITHIVFQIPFMLFTSYLLCISTAEAMSFSMDAFSGLNFERLRSRTAKYIGKGLSYVLSTAIPLLYNAVLVPKILNLWDSF